MTSIEKEKQTVERMIRFYCRHHQGTDLCNKCESLIIYTHERLDMCPFGNKKSSCRQCTVHCYSPERRKQIRQVMRYSGPRMIFYRPFVFIKHWFREQDF